MHIGWIYKDGEVIELPSLTAVLQRDAGSFISTGPELSGTSQGKCRKAASSRSNCPIANLPDLNRPSGRAIFK